MNGGKTMKRMMYLLLACVMLFAGSACGEKKASPGEGMTVDSILNEVMKNVDTEFEASTTLVNSESFPYFAFIDYEEGFECAVNEAMMNAVAHSAVLVRVPDGTDAANVASDISANADPRKWICVEAEKTEVVQNGNLVLLVMSFEDTAKAVVESFNEFCSQNG